MALLHRPFTSLQDCSAVFLTIGLLPLSWNSTCAAQMRGIGFGTCPPPGDAYTSMEQENTPEFWAPAGTARSKALTAMIKRPKARQTTHFRFIKPPKTLLATASWPNTQHTLIPDTRLVNTFVIDANGQPLENLDG
jgi:hypothetical protein